MTQRAKAGGVLVVLAFVCLVGWHFAGRGGFLVRLAPKFARQLLITKPKPSPRMANLPSLYLWAWERPEDLQFLGDRKVGVAFLANTVSLMPPLSAAPSKSGPTPDTPFFNSIRVNTRPRLQPLRVNPGTPLIAVVRIESVRAAFLQNSTGTPIAASSLSPQDLSLFATVIASVSQTRGVTAVQIDFDATQNEQALYRDLLVEVRKQMPPDMPLSITALASWCIGDRWLEQLPPNTIDEAVPMLFRMGTGTTEVERYVTAESRFAVGACATSLGLSTDESFSRDILSGKIPVNRISVDKPRIYVFSPHSWDSSGTKKLLKDVSAWHGN